MIHTDVPARLVDELYGSRVVLVLGAGVSATSKNKLGESPPLWGTLLSEAAESVVHASDDKTFCKEYYENCRYLEAAEVIVRRSPAGELGDFLEVQFRHKGFAPSKLHAAIRDLDAKVVVTTNYDTLYEDLCCMGEARAGYSIVKYYDTNMIECLRSKQSLIVKAHGCITDVSNVILSRTQYALARRTYRDFFMTLDAMFLLNTVLFVGCSLDDPDLQLLLETAAMVTPKSRPHYALLTDGVPLPILHSFDEAYHIEPWTYVDTRDHANALSALSSLLDLVTKKRIASPK